MLTIFHKNTLIYWVPISWCGVSHTWKFLSNIFSSNDRITDVNFEFYFKSSCAFTFLKFAFFRLTVDSVRQIKYLSHHTVSFSNCLNSKYARFRFIWTNIHSLQTLLYEHKYDSFVYTHIRISWNFPLWTLSL